MYYIKIDGVKNEYKEIKMLPFYFLEGYNSEFQKGVMYVHHDNSLYPLYCDDALIQLPEYAGMDANDFKATGKMEELTSKIQSGKGCLIDSATYMEKWKEGVGEEYKTEAQHMREKKIMNFRDFTIFEKEYHDATDRIGNATFKDILEVILDKKLKKSDFSGEDKTIDYLMEIGARLNDTPIDKLESDDKKFLIGQIGAAHGAGSGTDGEREYHIDPSANSFLVTLDDEHELELSMDSEKLVQMYKDINKKVKEEDDKAKKKKEEEATPAAPAAETPAAETPAE